MKRSLITQLTLLVAAIFVVLFGVLVAVGHSFWREVVREQIDARLSAVADSRCDFVQEWIGRQRDRVDLFATRGVLRNFLEKHVAKKDEEPQRTQSQENLDGHVSAGAALMARIASREGRVMLSSDKAEVGRDLTGDPVFVAGLVEPVVGAPRSAEGRMVVDVAAPSRWIDGSRGTIGVVMLTLDATPLAKALRATTGLGQTGEVLLGMREGTQVRFLFPPRHRDEAFTVPLADVPAMAAAIEGREHIEHTRDYRGEPVLAVGCPIGYGDWFLMAKMDAAEAYAPIVRAVRYALVLGAVIMLVGLAAAWALARGFTRPIRRLAAAAESVARGDLDVVVPVKSGNEAGELTASFNEMTAALRVRTAEREQAEKQLAEAQRQLQQHAGDLENTVRERTEKLRETAQELEAFSYSITHDMRAPLRAMTGFSDILIARHDTQLDETGRDYLQHIGMAARRMDALIVDILNYSKVVRSELKMRPVNVEELIREITATYPALQAARADITVESPLPPVMANGAALTQIVSNLLGNAVKFVAPGVRPHVRVRGEADGDSVRLWFEDNGIGIAKDGQARLFHIFTRLHAPEEYEGTGIGLAIVRKAAERMGGSAGVESEEGKGSRFWVRLKQADDS